VKAFWQYHFFFLCLIPGLLFSNYEQDYIEARLNNKDKELFTKWFDNFKDGRKDPQFLKYFFELAVDNDNLDKVMPVIWKEYGDTLSPDDTTGVNKDKRLWLILLLGRGKIAEKNYREAFTILQRGKPDFYEAWHYAWLIEAGTKAKRYTDLSEIVRRAYLLHKQSPILEPEIWEARYNMLSSSKLMETFKNEVKPSPDAYYYIFKSLSDKKKTAIMASLINRFLEDHPKSWQAQFWAGYLHLREREFGEAAKFFEAVLVMKPGHLSAIYLRATCLKQLGFFLLARDTVKKDIILYPDKYRPYLLYAEILRKLEDYEEADIWYQKGLNLKENE
jgi:tetratricopeptide (TPR) repeat protein